MTKKYTLDTITTGESWACRFRTQTFVLADGSLADNTSTAPGEPAQGTLGVYQGIGVISVRDTNSRRVVVQDTASGREFVVDEQDTWDYDRAVYVD
jgi:hypothetical protein